MHKIGLKMLIHYNVEKRCLKLTKEAFADLNIIALKNLAIFTRKHLSQSLFFNKVSGLQLATILIRLLHDVVLVPLLSALNSFTHFSIVSIVIFE